MRRSSKMKKLISKLIISIIASSSSTKAVLDHRLQNTQTKYPSPSNLIPGQTKITIHSNLLNQNRRRQNPNDKSKRSSDKCEKIYISHCQNIPYNQTNINLSPLNFYDQDEAGIELGAFYDLFTSGCKRNSRKTMTLLVCSLYAPTCIEVSKKVKKVIFFNFGPLDTIF